MLDVTRAENLEGAAPLRAKPFFLRGLIRKIARSRVVPFARNAGIVLAVFAAAAMAWIAADFLLLRAPLPKAVAKTSGRELQTARADAMVKDILDRPLFSSDRSPAPEPPSPEELAAIQPPVLKSHLTGITILSGTRLALFTGEGNAHLSLKEGDDIDGFKVRTITPDQVILASAFGQQILRPGRGLAQTVKNSKPVSMGNFDPDKN